MADSSPLSRPTPRRPFELTPVSTGSSNPPTPPASNEHNQSSQADHRSDHRPSPKESPSRTRSILNLTSSTLFGIYAPDEASSTPWGTGAQTPSLRASNDDKKPPVIGAYQRPTLNRSVSQQHHTAARKTFLPLTLRTGLLFLLGVAYGVIVIHLHDDRRLAPVKVEGIERYSRWYLMTWGVAGVLLGSLLPWVDTLWEETMGNYKGSKAAEVEAKERSRRASSGSKEDERPTSRVGNDVGAGLTQVIRGMGAFFGVAFAIVSQSSVFVENPELIVIEAETAVGINLTGLAHSSACESCAVVFDRPVQGRVPTLDHRWYYGYRTVSWYQSGHGATTCPCTLVERECHEHRIPGCRQQSSNQH